MSQHWDYLTAKDNQRQVIVWTVAAVTLPAAGAFLWWLSEKGYNNLAPYRVSQAHKPTPMKQATPLVANYACQWHPVSNRLCALQYQYRPGSISGYIARVLAGHADRRRSKATPGLSAASR